MTSLLRPLAIVAAILALASCAPAPPPPPPGPPPAPYVAPPPAAYVPAPVVRRCAPGKHYIGGHRNRAGHWVRGHCVWNHRH